MIVIRVIKDPDNPEEYKLSESRPCNNCVMAMISFGIDKVYYSTRDGALRCERVTEMELCHESRGFKHNIFRF